MQLNRLLVHCWFTSEQKRYILPLPRRLFDVKNNFGESFVLYQCKTQSVEENSLLELH